jgi:hypothetical protein
MMEEDFYSTIKFKNGEEIFCKVSVAEETSDRTLLLISNAIIVEEIKKQNEVVGYKLEPWLKTTTEDLFIVNCDDVLTMSESSDVEMIMMHQDFINQLRSDGNNESEIDRKMGYISSVNEAKILLEKIFKES